ncbi:MAG: helix-turn-helix domain-containing protein [Alcaligenes pakistanensis]
MANFSSLIQKAKENNEYWESSIRHKIALALLGQLADLKLTQTDLAKKSGVSAAYISRVLSGNENMSIKTIIKLTRSINLSFDVTAYPSAPKIHSITQEKINECTSTWNALDIQSQFRRNHGSPLLSLIDSSEAVNQTFCDSTVTAKETFAFAA